MKIEIEISGEQISDQLVTAFEGGSNYWLHEVQLVKHQRPVTATPWYSDGTLFEDDFSILLRFDDPEKEEGNGSGTKIVGPEDVRAGLQAMAAHHFFHFADLMKADGDAITADVFLQYVLFGNIIYG